ncbi:MAG: PilZ domain-containing protein [Desulfobacteraceae bacterium]|nr:MAG: PilZ domain-containing protein [Desulfobacteraceae bacterium]
MAETVYITSENQAIFRCPVCQRTKTVDVTAFDQLKPPLRFRMKCPCGHETTAIVEKRRRFRKETSLPGHYVHYVNGQPKGKGAMTVKDLSTTGMKLEVVASGTMAEGDLLKVEFKLDNPARSLVTKKLIIRNIVGNLIGTQFAPTETVDKALGFYLRS